MPLPVTIAPDRPVLIAGPTASGKSELALEIAERDGGMLINADALQVFSNWRLLTARPSVSEEARAPHRLYGHLPQEAAYSAGHWLRDVRAVLSRDSLRPIFVGGTGLYFKILTQGLAEIPDISAATRAEADALRAADGGADMAARLLHEDPETSAHIDMKNPMRVQRAWEVLRQTGRPLAQWQRDTKPPLLPRDACTPLVLMPEKGWLNARIDRRFDAMIAAGALEEARANLATWNPAQLSARAIGAPDLIAHLQGELTLTEATARAKIASHQYAKRQRTWFRSNMAGWIRHDPSAA